MNVFVIGGGVFLGRHITDALLAAGHTVTQFNRGISGEPRAGIETIRGDRKKDFADLLGDRTWDAVVDTCAYVPGDVRSSTQALKNRVGQYVLISTVSVYDYDRIDDGAPLDESAPVAVLPENADQDAVTPETYGALKILCEDIVTHAFDKNSTIVRCGLMVGPHDQTDRFTYWVARAARGGRMLAPPNPAEPMQFIDVRDVAAFVVGAIENRTSGIFNVTGRPQTTTFGTLFERVAAVTGVRPEIVWLDREAIARAGLEQWKDVPLWIEDADEMRRFHAVVIERALAAGLKLRPLDDTVRETLKWAQSRPPGYVMKHGMTPERETEALSAAKSPFLPTPD